MATGYIITDWREHYETGRTLQFATLKWVPICNRFDSEKMLDLLELPDGLSLLGMFILLVEVASRQRLANRGELRRDTDRWHDAKSLSRLLRVPVDTVQRALELFSDDPFRWLTEVNGDPTTCTPVGNPVYTARQKVRAELNSPRTEKEEEEGKPPISPTGDSPAPRPTRSSPFKPPTLAEIKALCSEKGYTDVDPQAFVDHYEAKGWMIGRNRMKSWPHALAKADREGWAQSKKQRNGSIDYSEGL